MNVNLTPKVSKTTLKYVEVRVKVQGSGCSSIIIFDKELELA